MNIWTELEEYTGETELQELWGNNKATVKLAQGYENWDGSREDWYRIATAYIYELTDFNSREEYDVRLSFLRNVKGQNVLDYGCGIGTAALYLARANHVMGFDINETCIDFARWRKGLTNNTTFVNEIDLPLLEIVDLVVAIDVLEHIEDLESLIHTFGKHMKPGAKLYHFDGGVSGLHPMHFDHAKHIDGWLEDAGFEVLPPLWAIKGER